MLTSLLPGYRGIRSALVAGYLWFTSAWLLFADLVNTPNALNDNIVTLLNFFGFGGKIVAVSAFCLLLGEVSSAPIQSVFFRLSRLSLLSVTPATIARPPTGWHRLFFPMSTRSLKRAYARVLNELKASKGSQSEAEAEQRAIESINEILFISPRLIIVKPELYAEHDRLKSESEFRDALLLPVPVLTVAICMNIAMPPLLIVMTMILVVLLVCYLFLQARQQFHTAFSMVAHRVADGVIDVSVIADVSGTAKQGSRDVSHS